MKKFISENWYKLMVGSSLLMASFGFMISSLTSANAQTTKNAVNNSKIVPLNSDGTITVKLATDQLNTLTPYKVQAVNLASINGNNAACYMAYKSGGETYYALAVTEPR